MPATRIAALLLIAAVVLGALGFALRSRKLGIAATVTFILLVLWVAGLSLMISRM